MTRKLASIAAARHTVSRNFKIAACAAALLASQLAWAADVQPKPPGAAANKQQKHERAKDSTPEQDPPRPLGEHHLRIADRVLTGDAACEFDQTVSVLPINGQPGHFRVTFKKVTYTVIPEETTSGAIRLEDKKAGIVWLQIPSKSMLMNAKIGQRMVDGCTHAEQRAAVSAVQGAAQTTPGATKP